MHPKKEYGGDPTLTRILGTMRGQPHARPLYPRQSMNRVTAGLHSRLDTSEEKESFNLTVFIRFICEIEQDRQCRCDVTMRCVRAAIVVVEKQYVLHILSACL